MQNIDLIGYNGSVGAITIYHKDIHLGSYFSEICIIGLMKLNSFFRAVPAYCADPSCFLVH